MRNLLQETYQLLNDNDKSVKDVLWVGSEEVYFTWDEFAKLADKKYDNGYGGNEVPLDLVIVGKDFWLERHEYDGSEWWEFKKLPIKPEQKIKPFAVFRDQATEEHYYSNNIKLMNTK